MSNVSLGVDAVHRCDRHAMKRGSPRLMMKLAAGGRGGVGGWYSTAVNFILSSVLST